MITLDPSFLRLSILFLMVGSVIPFSAAAETEATFRLYTEQAGVYQVRFEELEETGLGGPVPSDSLSVWNLGEPVPFWLDDGGDGVFGPSDRIELVARRLTGKESYFHPYSAHNVYQVRFDRGPGPRMRPLDFSRGGNPETVQTWRTMHWEKDRLLIRLSGRQVKEEGDPELWYWSKLTHIDSDPFSIPFELPGLDFASSLQVELSAQVRGISRRPRLTRRPRRSGDEPVEEAERAEFEHALEFALDEVVVGAESWNGKGVHSLELPSLTVADLQGDARPLTVKVPVRVPEGSEDPIVDIVMLNWLEARYPFDGQVAESTIEIELSEEAARVGGFVQTDAAHDLVAYHSSGDRIEVPAVADGFAVAGVSEVTGTAGARDRRWWLVPAGGLRSVQRIELDSPSDLRSTANQADYLVITHPRLRQAVGPLVEYHRKSGLKVELVDIQDVYDEFNHGVLDPRALRDFIAHAYHSWERPAPRYVLLVGDASWDSKNELVDDANYANWADRALTRGGQRFRVKDGLPPAGSTNDRNLIPAASYHTSQGHAASDNYFVSVDGDDFYPDLAIGRFPVVEPEEVAAIVEKTLRYADQAEVGPWRRRVLWITNENRGYQRRSDRFASSLGELGFGSLKVYPSPEEADNAEHQETLTQAFAEGQLLVHFIGHGGRLIWRTGPPDIRKNHDLFTLDHLDSLPPSNRLPVILSMTCHSGPFDHPSADSIGEKFLRLEGRGAIAVVAASWRNGPAPSLSAALVEELSHRGRIGDAFRQAKMKQRELLVEIYNLFGDPAIPIARPEQELTLEKTMTGDLRATLDLSEFTGRALIEWVADDEVVESGEMVVTGPTFEIARPPATEADWVRVYVWNETEKVDGLGALRLVEATE